MFEGGAMYDKKLIVLLSTMIFVIIGCSQTSLLSSKKITGNVIENQVQLQLKQAIPVNFIPKELNIVAVGDSLTEGVGDSTNSGGYLAYLEKKLMSEKGVKEVHIKNFGNSGDTTPDLIKNLSKPNISKEIQQADIVMITIGGNDLMEVVRENLFNLSYPIFKNPQQKYIERIDKIISMIRDENESAYITLVGLYNPFYQWLGSVEDFKQVLDDWNDGSERVLQKYHHTHFVKIDDIFENNEDDLLYKDKFHPNDLGYEKIANRIYEELNVKEILQIQNDKSVTEGAFDFMLNKVFICVMKT